jgi:methylated-DNA-protein-cysteine methyltransferase-like protein
MLRLIREVGGNFFTEMTEQEFRESRVLQRIRATPPGFVRTYGDVSPGAPRFAGTVLARTAERVPWHRIVRADGSLAKGERQRRLLEEEGVPFVGGRVDMRVARLPD